MALRVLRESGAVRDVVLTFAQAHHAVRFAAACALPHVVILAADAGNSGFYWVVSEGDARRPEGVGYWRYEALRLRVL